MPVSLGRYPSPQTHARQTFYKRLSVAAGFVILVALVIGNAFVVKRQLNVQIENQSRVTHTRQVLFELERTESLLKDAETGQRGFLYTGETKYLEPYNLATVQIAPHLNNLAQLTADSPRQQTHLTALRSLIQAKLTELAQTISLYQAGKLDETRKLVKSDAGWVEMRNIRALIDEMEKEETLLESSRTATLQRSIHISVTSIYLASFIATFCLALMAFYVLREISRHERYIHEIRKREEWYRTTLSSIGDAVIATDRNGRVTFLNPVAEALTGTSLEQDAGKNIQEVFPIFNEVTQQPVENPVRYVIELGHSVSLMNHTNLMRSDGALIPIEDSAAPIRDDLGNLVGVVLVFRDVSKERKSLEVLRKTEKLAAAARLAASVAHEINNPLEAVVNLIFLAKATPGAPASVVEALTLAEQELERVAHITRQTLGFYRESNVQEMVDIPALIDSVLKLYSNKLRNKNIAVQRHFSPCPPLLGVSGELKQVISNLVANAVDAVGKNGAITLRAWCADEAENKILHVAIEDDGPGTAAEDIDRIFEPFFTTKKDVGTGLGLWVTKEIVERHGGSIRVSSQNNGSRGAAFNILIPCSPQATNGDSAS